MGLVSTMIVSLESSEPCTIESNSLAESIKFIAGSLYILPYLFLRFVVAELNCRKICYLVQGFLFCWCKYLVGAFLFDVDMSSIANTYLTPLSLRCALNISFILLTSRCTFSSVYLWVRATTYWN